KCQIFTICIDHPHEDVYPLMIHVEHQQIDVEHCSYVTFPQIPNSAIKRVQSCTCHCPVGCIDPDAVHIGSRGIGKHNPIGKVTHMPVVVHPSLANSGSMDPDSDCLSDHLIFPDNTKDIRC